MKLSLRPRTEPEVNLTSLIDVVLLLLIFFMVSTSFVKQSQIAIRLPEAESTAIIEQVPLQIDIMITESGTYLVNGRELINNRAETIRNALQKIAAGRNDRKCKTPACCHCDGRGGTAGLYADQHRHSERSGRVM